MGVVYKLTCPDCGHTIEFSYGVNGFSDNKYYTDEYINDTLARDMVLNKIYHLVNNPKVHFIHKLYYCENCNELSENIYAFLSSDNGTYYPEPTCNKCNHPAIMHEESRLDKVPCLKCFNERKRIIYMNRECLAICD